MADEVVKAPEVTPVEAPKSTTEKKSTTRGRKKGTTTKSATAKKAETKTVEKKPGRKPAAKKAKAATKSAPAQNFVFGKPVFQFKDKEISEELINKKVLDYLTKHPYIHAEKVETFVNLEEGKVYFTVDGFGNADFSVDL